ncbi:MAG: SBBP repeat-containing protein [Acidobacteriota bacterium]
MNRGGVDAFVVKLDPAGSSLLYATYIGGLGDDRAAGIAVDAGGFAHVVGATGSTNFPLFAPARNALAGGKEAFAFKLNANGSGWSTVRSLAARTTMWRRRSRWMARGSPMSRAIHIRLILRC